ncbi:NAD(P)/FAD-dependent oxidoreductase [Actinomadura sp. KC06]|uniref:flavin-containing monooxygenase n=1 Tax=Actinomadura sp. KC06 TaxID=2530369 RepID=UPI001049FE8D|nr:NAD(P)/FAD-dependent oxidoreductase [Actinomadura sp. KC06]TDD31059.1 NAD(P)/FAD-dependent oxidoreductase [Actinomadura sp. KC06]
MTVPEYDVLIVGAGFSGLNALHRLRGRGLRVKVLESGGDVGGTWYWNRYPGARVDIESVEYSYAFSDELQQEWHWPERYAAQHDVLRYLRWVAGKLDLRRDIEFDCRVRGAAFDDQAGLWTLTVDHGEDGESTQLRSRYCVMATGFLSAPKLPDIPGLDRFQGRLIHTGAWPQDDVDLGGRVGVIGTAASGVQVVQTVARTAERLTVFQRSASWAVPLQNEPMPEEYERFVKENYAEIRRLEHTTRGPGMVLVGKRVMLPETRGALDLSDEAREAAFEELWQAGGTHWGRIFRDLARDEQANDAVRAFLERKIRAAVKDPDVADLLIPDYRPFTRRPPGESGYYEAFNRDNVVLVDVRSDPIASCDAGGVVLASGERHPLDVLICATGFSGGAGAVLRMDVRGRGGLPLREHWAEGVRTHLGMMTTRFPNLFFINGHQSPCAHFSPPLLADYQSEFIGRLIEHLGDGGPPIEPRPDAEDAWSRHVDWVYEQTLIPQTDSWWMSRIAPGAKRQAVAYAGGFTEYRKWCERAADKQFQEFERRSGA